MLIYQRVRYANHLVNWTRVYKSDNQLKINVFADLVWISVFLASLFGFCYLKLQLEMAQLI